MDCRHGELQRHFDFADIIQNAKMRLRLSGQKLAEWIL